MRSFGYLFAVLILLVACKKKSSSKWEKSPKEGQVQQFVDSASIANMCDTLFLAPLSSETKGDYIGDVQSLVEVFSMESALASVLKLSESSTLEQSLQHWSGLAPWFNTTSDGVAFKHFNPVFIDWATEFIIPSPQQKIEGRTLQEWYDESFQRTAWTYLVTHDHLTRNDLWLGEVGIYKELVKSKDFQPISYFNDRFRGKFDRYEFPFDSQAFNASGALSFWMRRKMDGSEEACKKALDTLLDTYDAEWREKLILNSN